MGVIKEFGPEASAAERKREGQSGKLSDQDIKDIGVMLKYITNKYSDGVPTSNAFIGKPARRPDLSLSKQDLFNKFEDAVKVYLAQKKGSTEM